MGDIWLSVCIHRQIGLKGGVGETILVLCEWGNQRDYENSKLYFSCSGFSGWRSKRVGISKNLSIAILILI